MFYFSSDSEQIPLILSAVVVFTFLVMVLLMILVWHWRRRARAKETAVKMTMVLTGMEDNEPLRPSNVKPNTAKLRIVKEVDLRIGAELGNGAFGVVYKVNRNQHLSTYIYILYNLLYLFIKYVHFIIIYWFT